MSAATSPKGPFAFRDGESFNGAVARWAADNGVERMLDLTRVAGVSWGHRQSAASADEDSITALAEEMEIDPAGLLSRAIPFVGDQLGSYGKRRFQGLELPVTFIENQARRYAPAALALPGGAYHRALWDLRLLPICTETGQLLLDRCQGPICDHQRVGWRHTMEIDRCEHCMVDLTTSAAEFIPAELLEALQAPAGLFDRSRRPASLARLPATLTGDGGQLAVDLLIRLLPVIDPALSDFGAAPLRADPRRLCEAIAQSWHVMEGWPHRFLDLALMRVINRTKRHDDGNDGETMRFLKIEASYRTSSALAAIAAGIRDGLDLNGPNGPAILAATYTTKQGAKALGLQTTIITDIRRKKALRNVLILDQNRPQALFDRAEIFAIREMMDGRIGFDNMRAELGISHHGVEQIADMGLVEVLTHPFIAERYDCMQATRASFDRLLADLHAAAASSLCGPTKPLVMAMKAVGGRLKPWGPAFEALLLGHIPFHIEPGDDPLVWRIQVPTAAVATLAGLTFRPCVPPTIVFSTMMSKLDAMEALNSAPRQITEIFAHVPTGRGGFGPSLSVDDVLDIAETRITASELAIRRGVALSTATADARRLGVPSHGAAGFCRTTAEAAFGLSPTVGRIVNPPAQPDPVP